MLNGKQKRYLRALAVNIKPDVIIGKDGLSDNVIDMLDRALEAHELVKVRVLDTCVISANELSIDLARLTHSEIVQKIGKTLLFYRRGEEAKIKL